MTPSAYLFDRLADYRAAAIDRRMSPNDAMASPWYFDVGESAVSCIVAAGLAGGLAGVQRVLDLPCGHGRVTRHLTALFRGAEIDACDVDADGVRFCAETFGANPLASQEDLTQVTFPHAYDLIWIGSLFTHVDRRRVRAWMTHLARFLTATGILVATFHGRWCAQRHSLKPYLADEPWRQIVKDFDASGFGYADYGAGAGSPAIAGSYGVSLAMPHVLVEDLESIPGVRLVLYLERGWDDHHDVVALGKPAFDAPSPSLLARIGPAR